MQLKKFLKYYVSWKQFADRSWVYINKQNKLIDTSNSIVVTGGEGGSGKAEEGKWGQRYSERRRLDLGSWAHNTHNTTYNVL